MSDADRKHRWLTQAELDAMLNEEWHRGFYDGSDAMRRHAVKLASECLTGRGAADSIAQTDHPVPEDKP
jgi:hypothetical protein